MLRRIQGFGWWCINSENSLQLHLCFPFQHSVLFFLISTQCTAHCHFNRVQVQALPTEQAAPALTDSFSRDYDPYTHACKSRPPTTVGRTSLSVIIIITRARLKGKSAYTVTLELERWCNGLPRLTGGHGERTRDLETTCAVTHCEQGPGAPWRHVGVSS